MFPTVPTQFDEQLDQPSYTRNKKPTQENRGRSCATLKYTFQECSTGLSVYKARFYGTTERCCALLCLLFVSTSWMGRAKLDVHVRKLRRVAHNRFVWLSDLSFRGEAQFEVGSLVLILKTASQTDRGPSRNEISTWQTLGCIRQVINRDRQADFH